ncbi:hypothetical protein SK128_006253 [Halocaridina rubra]|uniref:Uncharacterized protein n=1 Tax=Halocaridina rubra TaxID=373956 RepID=A0AAN9AEA4_HALRR
MSCRKQENMKELLLKKAIRSHGIPPVEAASSPVDPIDEETPSDTPDAEVNDFEAPEGAVEVPADIPEVPADTPESPVDNADSSVLPADLVVAAPDTPVDCADAPLLQSNKKG